MDTLDLVNKPTKSGAAFYFLKPEEIKNLSKEEVQKVDPGFVRDFKCRELAIMAVNMIADFQRTGKSYTKIVDYPGFAKLFNDTWATKSKKALALKLKNIVRDLRESTLPLHDDWIEARDFFVSKKRNKK